LRGQALKRPASTAEGATRTRGAGRRPAWRALRPDWQHWQQTLRHGVFEVVIVAIGVVLGLAVNDWQGNVQRRQLASEARSALHSEIVANRNLVFARLRITAKLYALVSAHPDQVGKYVFERRNQPLLLSNSAWLLALDSGAARWLTTEERTSITGIYAEQDHIGELATEEMAKWTELAAYVGPAGNPDDAAAEKRAVRVWLAYAQRVQLGECIQAGRYERALGSTAALANFFNFCVTRRPEEDPGILYREWRMRGWISPKSPRLEDGPLTAPL